MSEPQNPHTPNRPLSCDEAVASSIFDVIPHVMQSMRIQMRGLLQGDLTIPQLRVLAALNVNQDLNHRELADHIGVSLPAISRMVDLMAGRDLVSRVPSKEDRRQTQIQFTPKGKKLFHKYRGGAAAGFAQRFAELSKRDKLLLIEALDILGTVFVQSEETANHEKQNRKKLLSGEPSVTSGRINAERLRLRSIANQRE